MLTAIYQHSYRRKSDPKTIINVYSIFGNKKDIELHNSLTAEIMTNGKPSLDNEGNPMWFKRGKCYKYIELAELAGTIREVSRHKLIKPII